MSKKKKKNEQATAIDGWLHLFADAARVLWSIKQRRAYDRQVQPGSMVMARSVAYAFEEPSFTMTEPVPDDHQLETIAKQSVRYTLSMVLMELGMCQGAVYLQHCMRDQSEGDNDPCKFSY